MPKFATRILVPAVAAACAVSLGACQAQTPNLQKEDQTAESASTPEQTTRRVGKAGIGYVTVPSDWISLATKSGSDDVEFCDLTATKIITMKLMNSRNTEIPAEDLPSEATVPTTSSTPDASKSASKTDAAKETPAEAQKAKEDAPKDALKAKPITIQQAIDAIVAHAKEYDVTDDNIQKETTTLANREATKLSISYGDGTKVICWVLLDDSGNVRYVAAEAPADEVNGVASIVESTYSF